MTSSLTDIFDEKSIDYEIQPNKPEEIKIKCFSGLHEDSNPSLSVNIEKEVFNCFSCGYSGSIDRLVKDLGVDTYDGPDTTTKQGFKLSKLRLKLDNMRRPRQITLPEPRAIINHTFKGIGVNTLQDFEIFITENYDLRDYACIPVYQNGKLKFIEGRYRTENPEGKVPKYLRLPEGVSVSNIMFPLDKVKDFSTIILVEGIFDVIKLHELGYDNSLCIFGTNNFTKQKMQMLDEFECNHVILLFDGDNSGRQAAKRISKQLEANNTKTTIVDLPDGVDPGVLTKSDADFLLSKLM